MSSPPQIVAYVRGTTQKVDLKGSRVIEEDFNFTLSVNDLKEAFGEGRLPLVYTAGEWETVDDTSYPVRAAIRLEDDPEAQAVSTEEKPSAWSKFKVGGTKVAEGGYRAGARVTEDGYRSASNLITNMKLRAARSARVAQGAPAFIRT